MKIIRTSKAPNPIGPYSQGIAAKGFVFVTGVVAIDPATGDVVTGGIREQAARVLESVKAILEEAGSSLTRVTKVTIYLKDRSLFKDLNEVYASYFGEHKPVRSTLICGLPREEFLLMVDAIAVE
jgi:2-iminobutanoate/2-iminopropanoate deaminase